MILVPMLAASKTPLEWVGALLVAALVILFFGAIYVGVFLRSYSRNRSMFGRSWIASGVVAVIASLYWPFTLFWWVAGGTPERRARRG